jgi:hypothetical protein
MGMDPEQSMGMDPEQSMGLDQVTNPRSLQKGWPTAEAPPRQTTHSSDWRTSPEEGTAPPEEGTAPPEEGTVPPGTRGASWTGVASRTGAAMPVEQWRRRCSPRLFSTGPLRPRLLPSVVHQDTGAAGRIGDCAWHVTEVESWHVTEVEEPHLVAERLSSSSHRGGSGSRST